MKSEEVVVKIDEDSSASTTSNKNNTKNPQSSMSGTGEFSFKSLGGNQTDEEETTIDHHFQRHQGGLPPLPPSGNNNMNNSQGTTSPAVSRSNNLSSRETRVSFQESSRTMTKRRRSTTYNDLGDMSSSSEDESMDDDEEEVEDGDEEIELLDDNESLGRVGSRRRRRKKRDYGGEVVRCTSNATFDRAPTSLRREKTRSRLMDPPDRKSGLLGKSSGVISMKSNTNMRSAGMMGDDDDDIDPFTEEDIPEDYMKERMSGLVIIEWVSLIVLIGALICSLIIPALKEEELWMMPLWKWDVLVIVLICGRLVSGWCIKMIIVLFIEQNFMLRKRLLYFVYGVREAVRNCLWLAMVLIAWHILFDEKASNVKILNYVTKVLECFLVSSLIWLVKTLILKVLASSFHVSAFFDRIQESLFNQFVIKTLSGPALYDDDHQLMMMSNTTINTMNIDGKTMKSNSRQSSRISEPAANDAQGGITLDHLHRLNQKNVSAWNMKRLVKMIRGGALITTLDEQIDDENSSEIGSEVEAKAAARKIFHNVARPRSRFIYLDDLLRFMQEEEAVKTLSLFEGASENGTISKSELKTWVVNAFRERRALSLTLNDTKTAVNKLHHIVNFVVGIILCLIWLIILNIATSKFLLFVSSQIVLVAFVFGNSCKNVFESIIFLFVVHPYDVGDRCEIDGVQMIVEEMNILTTVFLRYDNQKIMYPNFILFTKAIHNFYRSPDMGDAVEFSFHILTPPEKITQVRQRILSYIEYKKEHWYPNPTIILKDVDTINTLRIAVWLKHRMNHQDMGERWGRRALLVEECVKIFRDLDIEYRYLHCNVNVKTIPHPT